MDDASLKRIMTTLEPLAPQRPVDLAALKSLGGLPRGVTLKKASSQPQTEAYYRALGFSTYEAIDINSRFGSHVMDLNLDLARHYGFSRRYDLVVNVGTSEHIFDQAAVLRNAHNLAADGGLMLHIVPFTGYTNHGFYNYQPNLFYDLAAANGYAIVKLLLADRYQVLLDLRKPNDLAAHFRNYLALMTPSDTNNTFLVALLRRQGSPEFVHPCQGKYLADAEGGLVGVFEPQTTARGDTSSGTMFPPADPRRGKAPAVRLKKHVKRSLLRSLRRASRFVLVRVWPEL